MRKRLITTLVALAATLGLTLAAAPASTATPPKAAAPAAALPAYTQSYRGPYLCTWDGGASWMQITSWNISSTQRRYHISYREDLSWSGSSFRHINNGSVTIRTNSPYDDNPEDFYRDFYGTGYRSFTAYWWDVVGGVPVYGKSCSISQ